MPPPTQSPEEPIAIIGSACRFPGGCSSPSKLWELLQEPRDVRKHFDPKRLNLGRFYNADGQAHGSTDVKAQSYLLEEDNRTFDAGFFGINPAVASGMDPQQRLLLEVSYEACENAGVTLEQLHGSLTSVHIGSMSNDYCAIQARDTETLPKYNATGTQSNSIIANRVSYVLDLKGPSVTIDTACSSSLVALHQAVQGLRAGDSEAALVGGTNLIMDPGPYISESKLQMLSPDSQCRMWDVTANGYGRGEGVAVLLLKPLSRALADGDPVEGVIRATGVNSDGQSPGITMPFGPAQTELIRHTYRRAGLDPLCEADRPQYFECHGTGTQAGDPVEARAVYDAFFRGQDGHSFPQPRTLIVGSIKTIIGHLEGSAGLAGVIKVLLMLKHQAVPPNMLFNELNPKIAPYYGPGALQIATKRQLWPARPAGTPMRASVNSFGFGGTNAHVIIEALPDADGLAKSEGRCMEPSARSFSGAFGPLLFSAQSGPALLRNVQAYLAYAEKNASSLDLRDLSLVLQTHRSTHRVRTFFAGGTREELLESMARFVTSNAKGSDIGTVPRLINAGEAPGVLGIFTGQGAQWPTMGCELMGASPLFRRSLEACEAVLQHGLPVGHGHAPKWSLVEELAKEGSESRLGEAELAQPLCTALQIAQVDMLAAAGIRLNAVVGHSSGEIAATYAAGIITREAAMQIAYYRGLFAHLGRRAGGGGMLAVGLSLQAASELCRRPTFTGRLVVAASNAPHSCTLSGDLDAVAEVQQQLDREGTFARQLQVDTAYHSHHMAACADAYLKALLACDITVTAPKLGREGCVWSSSVRGDARLVRPGGENDLAALKGPYWIANMVQMVKFSQALESAIWHGGPFDVAIELGPHPALKGPVEQTLKAAYGSVPRYANLLRRKARDVATVHSAIGTVWSQVGPAYIDFPGYHSIWGETENKTASNICHVPPKTKILADLPVYSWDHDKVYWRESRISARYRTLADVPHQLLGRRMPDDNDHELRWRNVLRLNEIPWLRGHMVQGEVLLPGAAYVSIAAQAAQQVAGDRPIAQLAVEDVDILRPVVVPDNAEGVETLFTVQVLLSEDATNIDKNQRKGGQVVRARFAYYVCSNEATAAMMHTCSGTLVVLLGPTRPSPALPPREPLPDNTIHIEGEAIYDMFSRIGLDYKGAFSVMTGCDRALGFAATTALWLADSPAALGISGSSYVLHPVILDVAFQALFVAHTHPASLLLQSALLPSHIDRVLIDPHVPVASAAAATCHMDAWVTAATAATLDGDVSLYIDDGASGQAFAQVEGLRTQAAGRAEASSDRQVFCRTVQGRDVSLMGLALPPRDSVQDTRTLQVNDATERLTLWYIRRLMGEMPPREKRDGLQPHHQLMLEAFEHHLEIVRQGRHPLVRSEWLTDEPEDIEVLHREYGKSVEFRLMNAVGGVLARVVQGEAHLLLQVMSQDDMLNRFYMQNNTSVATNRAVGQLLKQITFKFPRCNMLEIGAGTGGTTWSVLNAIENLYDSYTFTDVSSAFFPAASEKFSSFGRIAYRTLDIEQDTAPQGFTPHSYDIVIAANVLHATRSLEETLARVRTLLRPGGYLVLLETTGTQSMVGFLFGGLPGWWQSAEPSRRFGPTVPTVEWHRLLGNAGFSGADTVLHDSPDESRHVTSCIVSQAVNLDVLRLRSPLEFAAAKDLPALTVPLLIIGGCRLATARLVDEITRLLPAAWRSRVQVVPSIDDLDEDGTNLAGRPDVICLHDADEPLFGALPMPAARLQRLQQLVMAAARLLWVTDGGLSAPPRASMIRGIMRVAPKEMPHLTVQVLGLEAGTAPVANARHCVEALLRLRHMEDLNERLEQGQGSPPLWAIEPESEILAGGEVQIPRVLPAVVLNERFAARTRHIIRTTDAASVTVQAVANANKAPPKMELRAVIDRGLQAEAIVQVEVEYALHIPCHGQGVPIYLVCGRVSPGDDWVMALSPANVSKLALRREQLVRVDASRCTPASIKAMAEPLLRHALIGRVTAHAAAARPVSSVMLLLFEPKRDMAERLEAELKAAYTGAHVEVCCVTSKADVNEVPTSWVRIHANLSRRMARQHLPHHVDMFVDCSGEPQHAGPRAREYLNACLPPSCETWAFDGQLLQEFLPQQLEAKLSSENQPQTEPLENLFKSAGVTGENADIDMDMGSASENIKMVQAADLAGADAASLANQQYLCDWRLRHALPLTVQPPDADVDPRGLLRPDRTYVIMGGSGGLGLSITRWMIRQGARHVVITSRHPRPDAGLQAEARRAGASVHMPAVDVTNEAQVRAAVAEMRRSMPPIAGVCNFSMVLHDAMFLDMDAQQLNDTLAAKVLGTEILDAIFGPGAEPLDFFIVTSSSASTIGNVAQANYHAANLLMEAVVARRRARGLPGSVVHIGWVADTGYITRFAKEKQLADHFRSIRLTPLSETDVQDAFALAVRTSRVGSSAGEAIEHDIIMGLAPPTRPMQASQASKTVWTSNPRLMALQPYSALSAASQQQQQRLKGRHAGANVYEKVAQAETEDDAVAAVAVAFGAKLESILQLPAGAVHERSGLERPIVDLGIDSLVAVEIRTWLLKEFNIEVPVVRILGGETVLQVCVQAAKRILTDRKVDVDKQTPTPTTNKSSTTKKTTDVVTETPKIPAKPKSTTQAFVADQVPTVAPPVMVDSSTTGRSSNGGSSPVNLSGTDSPTSDLEKNDDAAPGPIIIREAPMSAAQSRFWFVSKHSDNPAACNTAFYYRLQGRVNTVRLRHALQLVVSHHECLRTCYYPRLEDGHPMQGVMATSVLRFTHTEHAADDIETALHQTLARFKTCTWDLERGQTMAVALLGRKGEQERSQGQHNDHGYLVLGYHHITLDGWSVALFWRDVDRAYRMQPLASVGRGLSYLDYSLQQLGEEATGILDEDLAFWRAEFESSLPDTLPLLPMARGLDRSTLAQEPQQQATHHLDQELNPAQLAAVKNLSQRLRVSPFHVHLALLQILLARQAGIDDVCIGVVDANRRDKRFAETLGCFVNMLPVRCIIAAEADFASVARDASRKALAVFAHGTVPFDRILDLAATPRANEAHPLFQVSINYRTASGGGIDIWDLPLGVDARMDLSWRGAKEAENPYDISLGFFETPTGCLAQIWCSASLYGSDACRSLLDMYLRLLEAVACDPSVPVGQVPLHDDARVLRALDVGRGPETHFDWPATLSRRVRDMCRMHPTRTAVTDAAGSLSYVQLAVRTSGMARRLRGAGVSSPAHRVAVLCEPSIDGIVAMLAILEAKGVFVPLDVSLPTSRHADMLRLCRPTLILIHAQTEQRVQELLDGVGRQPGERLQAIRVDSDPSHNDIESDDDENDNLSPQPAFLLFTSGSTGTPKGILLTQANFVNHVALKTQAFSLQHDECVLQQSSLGFDMALVQTFSALANGGRLVIAPSDIRRDPIALVALVQREAVSMTIATPTEYLAWIHSATDVLSQSRTWRLAFSGGEQVPSQLRIGLRRLGISGLRLINCYGPTEITAAATFQPIPLDDDDPASCLASAEALSSLWRPYTVGKALPNYTVCIIDAAGAPQPLGRTGEICIGGAGVALGYLDSPNQTRTKFVRGIAGMAGTVYRTGDKGRLLTNGTLLCLGRLDGDTQIKLRGQRIELREIELAVIKASGGALESVVVSRRRLDGGAGGDVLIAHATLTDPQDPSLDDPALAQLLGRVRLPQAFVPAAIYILAAMPTTSNGKLDRKAVACLALPERDRNLGAAKPDADRVEDKLTVQQGELRLLWEQVLPVLGDRRIGPSSDFFLSGGNSLLLMKLQQAIKETTGVNISTKRMYEATTLRAMAHAVFNEHEPGTGLDQGPVDWNAETSVPAWLQDHIGQLGAGDCSITTTVPTEAEGIEVLLTGASTFLGSHLLTALLQHSAVRKVHCIAVPPGHQAGGHPQSDKVAYYSGSLLSPTLGLTPAEGQTLAQTINVVVHAGAHGHCLNRFATLRRPNLESLHVLASLALPRSVPLLFLSSPRCVLLTGNTDTPGPPGSLRTFAPAADGTDGYTASKWAGEVFLEKLVDHLNSVGQAGLRVAVHRPCTLVSDHAPNSDAMNGILRYSLAMRCVPRLKRAEGFLDFAPLDAVVDQITAAAVELALPATATAPELVQPATIRFRHHSGGIKTPFAQFRAHMEAVYGHEFDELDMELWLAHAADQGLDPLITAYIEALLESGMPLISPYLGAE
ncbi:hypothetical protein LRP88_01747 [Fusarium phalaenopsidis]